MDKQYDAMFAGVIGQDYEMLKLISPLAPEMSRLVGEAVKHYCCGKSYDTVQVLELGGGTGITTLSILSAADNVNVLSVDSEPTMQNQAKSHLREWAKQGRLEFSPEDALTALKRLDNNSFDLMASAYTLHNSDQAYRQQVIDEIFRVLKPGGRFINGDRYALDDISAHTALIQREVAGYFDVLTQHQRVDLLEQWVIHILSDESENHVMRESVALNQLAAAGFDDIELSHRMEVNALLTANKNGDHWVRN
ncbi:class I SAM-dependent methyltransferase [Methylomarinum vadi]|uniref:class I SAM-dependent methyltransferase n=1 Tax=Methylomarinum vadi TaxID=438855 RepID=UPI0004DFA66D|nr:class I SAM-dependent methyltransferase [Methylomarinum vadi]